MKCWLTVPVHCLVMAAMTSLAAAEQHTASESNPSPRGETEKQAAPMLYPVEVARNIVYYNGADADKARQKLDVYSPKGAKERPVVLFIHGGAWVFGDKDFFGIHAAV